MLRVKVPDGYFGSGVDDDGFDWSSFTDTSELEVSENLLDWVVGQDNVLKEAFLAIDEWIRKIKRIAKERAERDNNSEVSSDIAPKKKVEPGPYLLLLGEPGTGKSLIGQAIAEYMTQKYKEERIELSDILAEKNSAMPSQPKIQVVPRGEGQKIVREQIKRERRKKRSVNLSLKALLVFSLFLGLFLIFAGLISAYSFFTTVLPRWETGVFDDATGLYRVRISNFDNVEVRSYQDFVGQLVFKSLLSGVSLMMPGAILLFFGVMGFYFGNALSGAMNTVVNPDRTSSPKVIVDNSDGRAPFVDGTGARTSTLFGDIAWDPYQSGGLSTPEHQRVTAGLIHKAHMGVLYIDEVKNLTPEAVVDLLTVLEDGELPITMRGRGLTEGTAAMNVKTDPVPAMFMFVAAGNFDSLPQLHPALKDRFYGYGRIIKMNNYMPREEELKGLTPKQTEQMTVWYRRRYVKFVAQETRRFHLPPADYSACVEICEEARRRSDKNYAYTTRFRPLIGIIRTAGQLALNQGSKFISAHHVREAIEHHAKSIEKQMLEEQVDQQRRFQKVLSHGTQLGRVNGLVVITDQYSGERTGNVGVVKAYARKLSPDEKRLGKGSFRVTGLPGDVLKESSQKVLALIYKKYNVNLEKDYYTHIDFAQSYGVDGPSAGVAMVIAVASILENRPVRQDTAVTGEINITQEPCNDCLEITPVGGLYEKIKAAEQWGLKRAIIPQANYDYSVDPGDFEIEVIGAATLEQYLNLILVEPAEEAAPPLIHFEHIADAGGQTH